MIVKEVRKIEVEFRQLKGCVCKALDALEQRVDSRFSSTEQNIEDLDDGQRESLQKI